MKKGLLLIVALLLLAVPAYADFQEKNWQYKKNFRAEKEGMHVIQLDTDILAHTKSGFEDLRVIDARGKELSYQLLLPTSETYYSQESTDGVNSGAGTLNNVIRENQYSSITFDLHQPTPNNMIWLSLDTDQDYLRQIKVEGSSDNRNWNLIHKDKIYSVGKELENNKIIYPTADYRLIRVTVDAAEQKALSITEAKIGYTPVEEKDFSVLPGKISKIEQSEKDTVLIIDLGVKGYFVDHLTLEVSGRNYSRVLETLHSNDGDTWSSLSNGRIYHYQWSDYAALENNLPLRQACARYIKLIIHNQDSPPLDIKEVTLWGEVPKILVDLPVGINNLWYGNPESEAPKYDVAQFSHLVQQKDLPLLQPSSEAVNPDFVPIEKPWTERNRWLLNGVIAGAAVVLGFILIRNMKA
ncbi:DUF3999 family protein [Desulfotomaculum sp. 1211_IL3151]|uniref:DUF3999 family protein n=1 Tax=Desulfotomaculum sp. 1211_IL3151 TaxID=3084055 RepID=UPI002FDB2A35